MVRLRGSRKVGDRIRQVTDSERRREILKRGLIVEEDELALARKTAMTDAAFLDPHTGKKVYLHGGLYDATYGKEKAKRDAREGTPQEKKRATKVLPLYEQIYRDQLRSNKKAKNPISPEAIRLINEQAKRDVYERKAITPYDRAKERMRKKLGNYFESK